MNNYFIIITKILNLKSSKNSNSNDIMELISHFKDYVSIQKTYSRKLSANKVSTFSPVLSSMDNKKSSK